MNSRLLIVGVSTRAAAASAARTGFDVTAIDGYADLDQHHAVEAIAVPGGFDAGRVAARADTIDSGVVSYLSSFENHPDLVARLARNRTLWGNPPDVLRRVRDPRVLADVLARRGFATLAVDGEGAGPWLEKPLRSGGGHDIRFWQPGAPRREHHYLQQHATGVAGSVSFAAVNGRATVLGVTRQLVGVTAFGATGYRYCGSILGRVGDPQFDEHETLAVKTAAIAQALTEEFGLVGVNGVDFIAEDGTPFPTEVNPRWSASMELIERAFGVSVFGIHARTCAGDTALEPTAGAAAPSIAHAKAILHAPFDFRSGDTTGWLEDATIADVPRPHQIIRRGGPICTVFATGSDAAACLAALHTRAERLYARVSEWHGIGA